MNSKYLYKDFNGELFIFDHKTNGKCYIVNADNGERCFCTETKFNALFKRTEIEVYKYNNGVIV
jgi:hypothetical protein